MRTLAGTARAVAFPYVSRRVVVSRPSSDASRLGKRSLVRSLAAAKGDDAALAAFAKLGLKDLDEAARRFQYGELGVGLRSTSEDLRQCAQLSMACPGRGGSTCVQPAQLRATAAAGMIKQLLHSI